MQLTTLVYHYVRPRSELPQAGYGGLDVETFEQQLDEIVRDHTPVDWPTVAGALDERWRLPDDAVLLTFDDGLADHKRYVLPRLRARGLSAIFFPIARSARDGLAIGHRLHVVIGRFGSDNARAMILERLPDSERERHAALEAAALAVLPDDPEDAWKRPLQREMSAVAGPAVSGVIADEIGAEDELARDLYLDEGDLIELVESGMHLGGHGAAHAWLDHEEQSTVRAELDASIALLSRLLPGPWPFAYPYGGVNEDAAAEVERAGFRAAFTTVRDSHGPFRLGRVDGEAIGASGIREAMNA